LLLSVQFLRDGEHAFEDPAHEAPMTVLHGHQFLIVFLEILSIDYLEMALGFEVVLSGLLE
jgi:hypothetical protein